MKLATTLEQSRKLVEMGLDRSTSDCFWHDDVLHIGDCSGMTYPNVYPAWSTEALLALLPSGTTFLYSSRHGWHIEFVATIGPKGEIYYDSLISTPSALDAVYGLFVWLLERGRIRKGGES